MGQQECKLTVVEMKVLQWLNGYTIHDRIMNDIFREKTRLTPIVEKMVERVALDDLRKCVAKVNHLVS